MSSHTPVAVLSKALHLWGQKLHFLNADTLVFQCGNTLVFFSLSTRKQRVLSLLPGVNIDCFALLPERGLIYVGARDKSTYVLVFSLETFLTEGPLHVIPLEHMFSLSHIAVSASGKRLVTVSSCVERRLCYWDVESARLLHQHDIADTEVDFTAVSFHPLIDSQFVTTQEDCVSVWNYASKFDGALQLNFVSFFVNASAQGNREASELYNAVKQQGMQRSDVATEILQHLGFDVTLEELAVNAPVRGGEHDEPLSPASEAGLGSPHKRKGEPSSWGTNSNRSRKHNNSNKDAKQQKSRRQTDETSSSSSSSSDNNNNKSVADASRVLTCHCWTEDGSALLCGTQFGEVVRFTLTQPYLSGGGGQERGNEQAGRLVDMQVFQCVSGPIRSISAHGQMAVLGTDAGSLVWADALSRFQPVTSRQLLEDNETLRGIDFTAAHDTFVAVGACGTVVFGSISLGSAVEGKEGVISPSASPAPVVAAAPQTSEQQAADSEAKEETQEPEEESIEAIYSNLRVHSFVLDKFIPADDAQGSSQLSSYLLYNTDRRSTARNTFTVALNEEEVVVACADGSISIVHVHDRDHMNNMSFEFFPSSSSSNSNNIAGAEGVLPHSEGAVPIASSSSSSSSSAAAADVAAVESKQPGEGARDVLTCIDATVDEMVLICGFASGRLRVLDVSNRVAPRVLLDEQLASDRTEPVRVEHICVCPDAQHVAVSLSSSSSSSGDRGGVVDRVLFLDAETFALLGVYRLPVSFFPESSQLRSQGTLECRSRPTWLRLAKQWRLAVVDAESRRNLLVLTLPQTSTATNNNNDEQQAPQPQRNGWSDVNNTTFEIGHDALRATACRLPVACVAFHSLSRLSQEDDEHSDGEPHAETDTLQFLGLAKRSRTLQLFELASLGQEDAFAHLLPGISFAGVQTRMGPAKFPPEASAHKHFQVSLGNAVCVSPNGRFVASGGADGVIAVYLMFSGASADVLRIVAHKPEHGGVLGLAWHSSGTVVSRGLGGSFVWNINAFVRQQLLKHEIDAFSTDHEMDVKLTLRETRLEQLKQHESVAVVSTDEGGLTLVEKARHSKQEAKTPEQLAILNRLEELKAAIQAQMTRNDQVDQREYLQPFEFTVDMDLEHELRAAQEAQVGEFREHCMRANQCTELICARIRQQCWDNHEVKGLRCVGLYSEFAEFSRRHQHVIGGAHTSLDVANHGSALEQTLGRGTSSALAARRMSDAMYFTRGGLTVDNFAIRKPTKAELKRHRKIVFLRQMAILEEQWIHTENMMERPMGGPGSPTAHSPGPAQSPRPLNRHHTPTWTTGEPVSGLEYVLFRHCGVRPLSQRGQQYSGLYDPPLLPNEAKPARDAHSEARVLLFHPFALVTDFRKRMQLHLVNYNARVLQAQFNERFEELLMLKERTIEQIDLKKKRMRKISEELGVSEALFTAARCATEDPATIIAVEDSEITAPRHLTAEMRKSQKGTRQTAAELDAERANERALKTMMHGTLENRKDMAHLAEELTRPAWMDSIPEEKWTEFQRAEAEKFHENEEKLRIEQENRKRTLESELSKLRAEVGDLCRAFDSKIKSVLHQRHQVSARLYTEELLVMLLLKSGLDNEDMDAVDHMFDYMIEECHVEYVRREKAQQEFRAVVETHKKQEEAMVTEFRALDKNFRKEFADAGEHVEMLYRLFRNLKRTRGGSAEKNQAANTMRERRGSLGKDGHFLANQIQSLIGDTLAASLNTHASAVDNEKKSQEEVEQEEQEEEANKHEKPWLHPQEGGYEPISRAEFPPDFSASIAERFQQHRYSKHLKHVAVRRAQTHKTDMIRHLALLEKRTKHAQQQQRRLYHLQSEFRDKREELRLDCDVFLRFAQGLVETDTTGSYLSPAPGDAVAAASSSSTVLPSYQLVKRGPHAHRHNRRIRIVRSYVPDSSVLVNTDRGLVDRLNAVVVARAQDAIAALVDMMKFRVGIRVLQWEQAMLQLQHAESLDQTREVMLLRVTKNLQTLIKMGGHDSKQQAEMNVLERKLNHLKHLLKDELRIRERKLNVVRGKIMLHQQENAKLAAAGSMLTDIVGERQQITDSKTQQMEKMAQLMEKSQLSAERRKMLDISEAQRQNIDQLAKERDLLRLATFPSFPELTLQSRLSTHGRAMASQTAREQLQYRPEHQPVPPLRVQMIEKGVIPSRQKSQSSRTHVPRPPAKKKQQQQPQSARNAAVSTPTSFVRHATLTPRSQKLKAVAYVRKSRQPQQNGVQSSAPPQPLPPVASS